MNKPWVWAIILLVSGTIACSLAAPEQLTPNYPDKDDIQVMNDGHPNFALYGYGIIGVWEADKLDGMVGGSWNTSGDNCALIGGETIKMRLYHIPTYHWTLTSVKGGVDKYCLYKN